MQYWEFKHKGIYLLVANLFWISLNFLSALKTLLWSFGSTVNIFLNLKKNEPFVSACTRVLEYSDNMTDMITVVVLDVKTKLKYVLRLK